MPESQAPPADGNTGAQSTGTETGSQQGDQGNTAAGAGSQPKTFTEEQVNAIVQDRVARAKPADYDEAKAALEEKRKRDEGEKTELQKAKEAQAEETQKREAAERRADEALRTSAIRVEALKQGADDDLTAMYLLNDTSIEVKDGTVVGAKEAVEKALKDKPNLKVGGIRQSGGEFGGADNQTVAEQIAALERKGDPESRRQARDLKIAQGLSGMGQQ